MQDRPTALELVEAVRGFLETDVLPELSGRKQFHTRVAINVLNILARELEHEEEAVAEEWGKLSRLLREEGERPETFAATREAVTDLNRELSKRIHAGELDDRWEEVVAVIREVVGEKLAIANPGYSRANKEEE